jgi:hypothetical protein
MTSKKEQFIAINIPEQPKIRRLDEEEEDKYRRHKPIASFNNSR